MTQREALEQWGPYEIRISHQPAHTYESYGWGETAPRKCRAAASWQASAFLGEKRVHGARGLRHATKRKALDALRIEMRRRRDAIPDRIEELEAEYARLDEVLR